MWKRSSPDAEWQCKRDQYSKATVNALRKANFPVVEFSARPNPELLLE
jgi:hypothetical protein